MAESAWGAGDTTGMSETVSAADGQAVEPLLRFARAAHEAGGYPANELEPRIVELAQALGLRQSRNTKIYERNPLQSANAGDQE